MLFEAGEAPDGNFDDDVVIIDEVAAVAQGSHGLHLYGFHFFFNRKATLFFTASKDLLGLGLRGIY